MTAPAPNPKDTPMTTPELFPAPTPTFDLPPFPPELVKDTANHDGLRYIPIGDDGEWFVVLGHHDREPIEAIVKWYAAEVDLLDPDYLPDYDDLDFTWARLLEKCPDHTATKQGCDFCCAIEPGTWWLDWAVAKGQRSDVNHAAPGYFPITVWAVTG